MKARRAVVAWGLALTAVAAGACVDESRSEEASLAGNGGEGAAAEGTGGSAGTTTDAVGGAAGSEQAGTAGGGASGAQPTSGAGAGGASDVGTGGAAHAGGGGSAGTAVSDAGSSGVSSEAGRGGAGGVGASSDAGRGGDGGVAQTGGAGGDAGALAGGQGGAAPSESCGQGNACSPEGASCTVTVIWCEAPAWDQPCVCENGSWLCATGGIPEDCHECCQDAHDEGWFCVWGECLEVAACTATDCCVPGPDGDAYCAGEFGDCSTCQVNSDQDGGECTPTEC